MLSLMTLYPRASFMRGVALIVGLGLLTGCASMAEVGARGAVVTPTPEEQAFIDDFRQRAHRIGVQTQALGCAHLFRSRTMCAPLVVMVEAFTTQAPVVAGYRVNMAGTQFHVSRELVQAGMRGNLSARVVLAHEVAHWLHRDDWRIRNGRVSSEQAEVEANTRAVEVLMMGWDMTYQSSVHAVWTFLLYEAQTGRHAQGGHLSACDELRAFEQRLKLPPHEIGGTCPGART